MSAAHHVTVGGPSAGELAYRVDGQGLVRDVRERTASVAATHPTATSPASLGRLVSPLAWEPLQRLLSWGAREGMTAAELLDTCRTTARYPATRTPRVRKETRHDDRR